MSPRRVPRHRRALEPDDSKIKLLRSVLGSPDLHDRDAARLAWLFDDVRVGAGTVLAREGQSGRELYLIAEGRATLNVRGEAFAVLGPGDFLGDAAILANAPHAATATAETPMRMLVAGPEGCRALLNHAGLLRHIASSLASRSTLTLAR